MNEMTIHSPQQSSGSQLTTELAKMLGLVAPITMSADQCTIWLASAEDALRGIRLQEVMEVSMEVRRSVTRPSQIVPEISRLVAEKRAARSRLERLEQEDRELLSLPRPPKHIMDRDRSTFTASDWRELSEHLKSQGSPVRYDDDGKRFTIDQAA